MSEIIHSYTNGKLTFRTVRDSDGTITRNGSKVSVNEKGRKYVMNGSRHRKKKFLCAEEGCYKNTKVGENCRDHSEGGGRPPKHNNSGPEDPWANFRQSSM